MSRNNYFRFKQFTIIQERAAMKVGTDGVLLGAWTSAHNVKKILDIGAGTGLISLMMAQRVPDALITGIEYEEEAASEASENVKNSPWKQRINIIHISFQDFVKTSRETFDLIVSNPPFFINSKKPGINNLAIAKHNHMLPLKALASGAAHLLAPEGSFSVILPAFSSEEFKILAQNEGLFLQRETLVRPNNLKAVHRYMMEFRNYKCLTCSDSLNINNDTSLDYTREYKNITCDFYLNF